MQTVRPDFLSSEYFYIDINGWHLKEDAPQKLKDNFKKYMEQIRRPTEPEDHISQLLTDIKKHIKSYDSLMEEYKKLLEYLRLLKYEQKQIVDPIESIDLLTDLAHKNESEQIQIQELQIQELQKENESLRMLKYERSKKKKSTGKEFGHGIKPSQITTAIISLVYKRRAEKITLLEIRKEIKDTWNVELSISTISRITKDYMNFG